jgi:hypothetical protein
MPVRLCEQRPYAAHAYARKSAVIEALRTARPGAPRWPCLEGTTPALQVEVATFRAVLDGLMTRECGGPSGWTCKHVKAATAPRDAVFDAVHALVNLILSGCPIRDICLLDSFLIGAAKPGGGAQPVAIAKVFYRLAALCALVAIPAAGKALAPFQLGVGVSVACEIVLHAVSAGMLADRARATLSLDVHYGFNVWSALRCWRL